MLFRSLIKIMQTKPKTSVREETLSVTSTCQIPPKAIGFFHILHRSHLCLQVFQLDATARAISSARFAFAMGTARVTNAGTWGLTTPWFIALDNVVKLAALLGCTMLFGRPLLTSFWLCALRCWRANHCCPSLRKACFSSCLPPLCCWRRFLGYRPLSWFLHRSALDYCQCKVVLQFCAYWLLCRSHNPRASVSLTERIHWNHCPTCKNVCQYIGAQESVNPDTSHSYPRNLL